MYYIIWKIHQFHWCTLSNSWTIWEIFEFHYIESWSYFLWQEHCEETLIFISAADNYFIQPNDAEACTVMIHVKSAKYLYLVLSIFFIHTFFSRAVMVQLVRGQDCSGNCYTVMWRLVHSSIKMGTWQKVMVMCFSNGLRL